MPHAVMSSEEALSWLEWHLEQYKVEEDDRERAYHARMMVHFAEIVKRA